MSSLSDKHLSSNFSARKANVRWLRILASGPVWYWVEVHGRVSLSYDPTGLDRLLQSNFNYTKGMLTLTANMWWFMWCWSKSPDSVTSEPCQLFQDYKGWELNNWTKRWNWKDIEQGAVAISPTDLSQQQKHKESQICKGIVFFI